MVILGTKRLVVDSAAAITQTYPDQRSQERPISNDKTLVVLPQAKSSHLTAVQRNHSSKHLRK